MLSSFYSVIWIAIKSNYFQYKFHILKACRFSFFSNIFFICIYSILLVAVVLSVMHFDPLTHFRFVKWFICIYTFLIELSLTLFGSKITFLFARHPINKIRLLFEKFIMVLKLGMRLWALYITKLRFRVFFSINLVIFQMNNLTELQVQYFQY